MVIKKQNVLYIAVRITSYENSAMKNDVSKLRETVGSAMPPKKRLNILLRLLQFLRKEEEVAKQKTDDK